eukprot:1346291-Prymnesium_polylepis.1
MPGRTHAMFDACSTTWLQAGKLRSIVWALSRCDQSTPPPHPTTRTLFRVSATLLPKRASAARPSSV